MAKEVSPTETIQEAFGVNMPLPLLPLPTEVLALPGDAVDWHHHMHPRRDPLLTEAGGIAIRTVRLQKASKYENHNEYHQHYCGPPLPEKDDEKFAMIVLARAGYIPRHAIKTRGDKKPEITSLSEAQREQLWQEGQIRAGSSGETGVFLSSYILGQDLADVRLSLVDEFLETKNQQRKHELGHHLLGQALIRATAPIIPTYQRAQQDGLIPPNAPKPVRFVRRNLGKRHERNLLVGRLADQLVA